ncbi:MAG: DUF58 domain-containing protein [Acidobacteriota bacterium]
MRSFFQRAWRHRATASGLLFALALLLVGFAAVVSANNLLFLILAAMLATLMISGFISRLSLAGLELDVALPEHITARRKVAARLRVRNLKRWVPSFSLHLTGLDPGALAAPVYFPVLPGRTLVETPVEVCFQRRGLHREDSFRFSTGFPFGFLERRVRVTLRRQVLVYPSLEAQPGFEELLAGIRGDLEVQARGRGHDFYRIRPYEALESARHVDWKATAKTGELQVREFVREQERLLEIFLDLDVPDAHRDWFERALDCCAFLSWRMAERGARLRFRSQEADVSLPEMGDVYSILKYLALAVPAPGRPPIPAGEEESSQVVFTTAPERLAQLGWEQARVVSPEYAQYGRPGIAVRYGTGA